MLHFAVSDLTGDRVIAAPYDHSATVSTMAIVSERRDWFGARVPSVPPGRAIVYTRDDEEKSVVLNPQDYRHLNALDRDLDEIASDRVLLSELARKAHALEDTAGTAIEDADAVRALLGL
jgi:hypothetical protein